MTDDRWLREQIDDEWDRAEAEMLEQVNIVTGEPTVRLPGLLTDEETP